MFSCQENFVTFIQTKKSKFLVLKNQLHEDLILLIDNVAVTYFLNVDR